MILVDLMRDKVFFIGSCSCPWSVYSDKGWLQSFGEDLCMPFMDERLWVKLCVSG